VVLDREQGGLEAAAQANVRLLSLIPFKTVGLPLLKDVMAEPEWKVISQYLEDPVHFQNKSVQEDVARSARPGK
jgi:hypothetical protein